MDAREDIGSRKAKWCVVFGFRLNHVLFEWEQEVSCAHGQVKALDLDFAGLELIDRNTELTCYSSDDPCRTVFLHS